MQNRTRKIRIFNFQLPRQPLSYNILLFVCLKYYTNTCIFACVRACLELLPLSTEGITCTKQNASRSSSRWNVGFIRRHFLHVPLFIRSLHLVGFPFGEIKGQNEEIKMKWKGEKLVFSIERERNIQLKLVEIEELSLKNRAALRETGKSVWAKATGIRSN
jgi:hypothetical protein